MKHPNLGVHQTGSSSQCQAPNLVALRTKDGVVSLSDLVRSSLRLRPDRIPIGEVRGAEALDLLKAWGTGHPGGIGTIHAGTGIGALRRLEQLIQEAVITVPRALAAGDTVRWLIGDTESGAGATKRIHILVKPTRPDLLTNLVINTDRRTYLLELRSTSATYMASVSWQYPQDQLIALRRQNVAAATAAPIDAGIDVSKLRFRYQITGDNPAWRPLSAFDDGSKVYIEMPRGLAQGEAPPLFVIGPEGDGQLVNYRVRQNYYIVDRLFAAAELRLGGEHQQTVRISRTDGRVRCRSKLSVSIDGIERAQAQDRDHAGHLLPSWSGCQTIGPDQIFLLNASEPASLDGRYFGPLPSSSIIGRAVPIWTETQP